MISQYFVVLFLLLPLPIPLNSSSLNSVSQTESQQIFPRIDVSNGVINQILNMNDSDSAKINQILNNHNVSKDEILRRMAQPHHTGNIYNFRTTTTEKAVAKDETKEGPNGEPIGIEAEKAEFLNILKERLESIVERNSTRITALDSSTSAINDVAFYPLCSKNNQTSWLEENTAKLYFSSSIFEYLRPNTFLHRAVLRLRQKIPENLAVGDGSVSSEPDSQNGCSEVDDVIHVKVSIFVKHLHRGESKPILKKLVCHSLTLNRINSEWVEIDVRQVIKYWEKMYRASLIHNKGSPVADPMVVIDVEDEYQQPLLAGAFFEPTDCQLRQSLGQSLEKTFGLYLERRFCHSIQD
ncbi:protein anachronism isoform X2 [Contarinia nasturtii]|uniref:protein anachronism isoform X2 n=1 Tax=Contarinia nasturtii TaxID=265458 RepID=UPI0012D479D0|nr:protein anachronism isoform X2 [Contarinia nasturtii]